PSTPARRSKRSKRRWTATSSSRRTKPRPSVSSTRSSTSGRSPARTRGLEPETSPPHNRRLFPCGIVDEGQDKAGSQNRAAIFGSAGTVPLVLISVPEQERPASYERPAQLSPDP